MEGGRGSAVYDQDVWNDGVKGRGVINEKHPDVTVSVFKVVQGSMGGDGYGVISGPVRPVGKLMVVQGRREAGFNVFEQQSLKPLHYERGEGHRSEVC